MDQEVNNELSEALKKLSVHDHLCLIYKSRDEQFASAVPFMQMGLERNEKCIYIADDNTAAEVLAAMNKAGIDTDKHIKSGALAVITKKRVVSAPWLLRPG